MAALFWKYYIDSCYIFAINESQRIHSFNLVRGVVMSANYLKVYGANYLYVPWHKLVVYDNFDEQM